MTVATINVIDVVAVGDVTAKFWKFLLGALFHVKRAQLHVVAPTVIVMEE